MEIKNFIIFFAGVFANFVAAMKIAENIKLKKELKILRQKLGKE